jgi:hypothetical protein
MPEVSAFLPTERDYAFQVGELDAGPGGTVASSLQNLGAFVFAPARDDCPVPVSFIRMTE